ncbi:MAG: 6,7-dimethyl-8-ribityllumazine synthase [Planctomycetota bacterium]|nr:6,7-dimethyl-8-ribityllumazine synthase [Planctomycetota bacterium]
MAKRVPQVPEVVVVVSRYNAAVTDRLLDGARAAFDARADDRWALRVVEAPGAFEIPVLCLAAASLEHTEGVLALGCIIKGETIHDRVLADAVTGALLDIMLRTGVPVSLGVLTVNTAAQARARAGGRLGNKGAESMEALLDTMRTLRALASGEAAPASPARPDKSRRRR